MNIEIERETKYIQGDIIHIEGNLKGGSEKDIRDELDRLHKAKDRADKEVLGEYSPKD